MNCQCVFKWSLMQGEGKVAITLRLEINTSTNWTASKLVWHINNQKKRNKLDMTTPLILPVAQDDTFTQHPMNGSAPIITTKITPDQSPHLAQSTPPLSTPTDTPWPMTYLCCTTIILQQTIDYKRKPLPTTMPNVEQFAVPVVHPTTGETISSFKNLLKTMSHMESGQQHLEKSLESCTRRCQEKPCWWLHHHLFMSGCWSSPTKNWLKQS